MERGTPQFMRVTLALFSAGLATFALLYCAAYPSGAFAEFGLTWRTVVFHCPFPRRCWLLVCCLLARYPMPLSQTSDGHGANAGLHLYVTFDNDDQLARYWIMRALITSLSGVAAVGMTYSSEETASRFVAFHLLYISITGRRHERRLITVSSRTFQLANCSGGNRLFRAGLGVDVLGKSSRITPFSPDSLLRPKTLPSTSSELA